MASFDNLLSIIKNLLELSPIARSIAISHIVIPLSILAFWSIELNLPGVRGDVQEKATVIRFKTIIDRNSNTNPADGTLYIFESEKERIFYSW